MNNFRFLLVFAIASISAAMVFAQIPVSTSPGWLSADTAFTMAIAAVDIDNDGDLDLAAGNYAYPLGAPKCVYYNNNGILETSPSWQSLDSTGTKCIAWGDFDNDGDADLACGNVVVRGQDGMNTIYENFDGRLSETPVWFSADNRDTYNIRWADYDRDGDLDLFTSNFRKSLCFYQNQNGIIDSQPIYLYADNIGMHKINFADMDNDSDLDLVISQAMRLRVYLNNNGVFAASSAYTEADTDAVYDIAVADVDRDGDLDIGAARYNNFGSIGENWSGYNGLFNNTGNTLAPSPIWNSSDIRLTTAVAFADFDADGYPELAACNHPAWDSLDWVQGNDVVYNNVNGNLVSQPAWISNQNDLSTALTAGDIDNGDLVTTSFIATGNGSKSIFYLPNSPLFKINYITVGGDTQDFQDYCCEMYQGWVSFAVPIPNQTQVVFNYIYSNSLDLVVANKGQNKIYFNDNTANSQPQPLPEVTMSKPVFPKLKISPRDTNEPKDSMMDPVNALSIYEGYGNLSTFNYPNISFWRIETQWADREEIPGFYTFSRDDEVISAAYQQSKDVCISAFYIPPWADTNGDLGPEDLTAMGNFFQVLLHRYKPGGILGTNLGWSSDYGIKVWSMENEPTSTNIWGAYWFAHIDRLVLQLQNTYSVVKTIQPDAVFGSPNFSFIHYTGFSEWYMRNVMNDFYNAGARGYFDVMFQQCYHYPYNDVDPCEDWIMEILINSLVSVMNYNEDFNTPVWITEGTFWTDSEEEKIRYLYSYNVKFFSLNRIERITFGWDAAPALMEALNRQAGLINGTVFDYRLNIRDNISGDTTFVFAFRYPDDRMMYTIRTKTPPPHQHSYTLPLTTPAALVIDMFGDTTEITSQGIPGDYYYTFPNLTANPLTVVEQYSNYNGIEGLSEDIVTSINYCYPNPSNNETVITFYCPEMGEATLELYNINGEKIIRVNAGNFSAGEKRLTFNSNEYASGIYFYRIILKNTLGKSISIAAGKIAVVK